MKKVTYMKRRYSYANNDYSYIGIGLPVVVKGERLVVYITEILGETLITTEGNYTKEQLGSVIQAAILFDLLSNYKN